VSYPFAVNWSDGTRTAFPDLLAHNRALARCSREGHQEMPLQVNRGETASGCWRCLTTANWAMGFYAN